MGRGLAPLAAQIKLAHLSVPISQFRRSRFNKLGQPLNDETKLTKVRGGDAWITPVLLIPAAEPSVVFQIMPKLIERRHLQAKPVQIDHIHFSYQRFVLYQQKQQKCERRTSTHFELCLDLGEEHVFGQPMTKLVGYPHDFLLHLSYRLGCIVSKIDPRKK